jgi:hypothetical protein
MFLSTGTPCPQGGCHLLFQLPLVPLPATKTLITLCAAAPACSQIAPFGTCNMVGSWGVESQQYITPPPTTSCTAHYSSQNSQVAGRYTSKKLGMEASTCPSIRLKHGSSYPTEATERPIRSPICDRKVGSQQYATPPPATSFTPIHQFNLTQAIGAVNSLAVANLPPTPCTLLWWPPKTCHLLLVIVLKNRGWSHRMRRHHHRLTSLLLRWTSRTPHLLPVRRPQVSLSR